MILSLLMTLSTWHVAPAHALLLASDGETASFESTALDGFCPVSYQGGGKPSKGKPEFKAEAYGRTYLLSSKEALEKFKADPDKYIPANGGTCTTALGGSYGNRFAGDPKVFHVIDGTLYLFSSERARKAFDRDPPQYIAQARKRYPGIGGVCPVTLVEKGETVEGDPKLVVPCGPFGYAVKDEDARKKFRASPDKYIPMFNGYCAQGVSRGQRHPCDGRSHAVIDGHLYMFWDDQTRDKFMAEKETRLETARKKWPEIEVERNGY